MCCIPWSKPSACVKTVGRLARALRSLGSSADELTLAAAPAHGQAVALSADGHAHHINGHVQVTHLAGSRAVGTMDLQVTRPCWARQRMAYGRGTARHGMAWRMA